MSEHHRTGAWTKLSRTLRPQIAAALPLPCIERCGRLVQPGEAFDLAHRVSVAAATAQGWARHEIDDPANLGPAHRTCNRTAGGRDGARATNARRETRERADPRRPRW